MITQALETLRNKINLDFDTMKTVMNDITEGKTDDKDIMEFLTLLREKGESVDEITAAATVMKEKCIKTPLDTDNVLDIVGTGGDKSNTFNISTASCFVSAAAGIPTAKHGNRALTSKSGAIDVLEALNINVNKTPDEEKEIFNKLNLCFMFAQNHHPAMKYALNARKQLKFRTLFNILGPLTNPANAKSQLFGVFDKKLTRTLCEVITNLGVKNTLVIHGKDGLDEATVCDETYICEAKNGIIKEYSINPEMFGMKRAEKEDLIGGSPNENAKIIRDIFENKDKSAKRDIVILNSALAIYTYNSAKTIEEGIEIASDTVNSGKALQKLNDYVKFTSEKHYDNIR